MIAVIIDGPRQGVVMSIPEPWPVMKLVDDTRRSTIYDGPIDDSVAVPLKVLEYNRICVGPKVCLYSLETDDEALLKALRHWVCFEIQSPLGRLLSHAEEG